MGRNLKFLIIGGSDAGISAALRARELDDSAAITVVLADGGMQRSGWQMETDYAK